MSAALTVEHVSVELGGRPIVEDVSFSVEHGEWVTLIGPNGAGKTTLLRAVAGLLAHRGTIAIDGRPLRRLGRRELARQVAVVPQVPLMPNAMTIREYVLLGRTPYVSYAGRESRRDHAAVEQALGRLDLFELADRELGSSRAGSGSAPCSRGACAEAQLLLLDEPTTALDAGRQQEALELIDELRLDAGLTVVATMHDLRLPASTRRGCCCSPAGESSRRGQERRY